MMRTEHLHLSKPARVSLLLLQAAAVMCLTTARLDAQTASDPYPQTTIAFFNAASCPSGWEAYTKGNGRFVVPVTVSDGIEATVMDEPLLSEQDPMHAHAFSSNIKVRGVRYAGKSGGSNTNLASDGKKEFSGTTEQASSNVPYIQMLICIKTATPGTGVVPSGVTAFFRDLSCPTGWTNITQTLGRFLVAVPEGGSVQGTFGGDKLTKMENRKHKHKLSGSVDTKAHGIAAISGCKPFLCAKGYAKHDTYDYSSETDLGDDETDPQLGAANLPYIQLMQCRKQ